MNKEFKAFETHGHFETKEKIKTDEYKEEIKNKIERLIEKPEAKIGEGKSAGVYEDDDNNNLCYKTLKIDPAKNIVEGPDGPQIVNSVSKEANLLEQVYNLSDGDVEVPKPHIDVEAIVVDNEGNERSFQFISMERLNAVSLKDVLEGKEDFPMKFIEEGGVDFVRGFFRKLESFIQKMHENKIYHRDVHAGNIMINIETGKPGVIDLGAGRKVEFSNMEDREIYSDRHPLVKDNQGREIEVTMLKDENGLTDVKKDVLRFLTPDIKRLTKVA